ncbi:hypothetical protein [Mesorhizobium sp. CAU 1741]|uniref:hypothetical protein n=1 Tax=Mesorhizobium sp. CAU 1741 TaxID=3140366 RepID=UPI00325AC4E0
MDPDEDLRDVIDVVMEMGWKTGHAEKSPLPSPGAETPTNGDRLSAHLHALAGRARYAGIFNNRRPFLASPAP